MGKWILALFLWQSFAIHATDSWYEKKLEGWYYFEDPKVQKEKQEISPDQAQQMLKVGGEQLEKLLALSIVSPSLENVERYMQYQKKWIDQNAEFANVWGKALLNNPYLGDFLTNPTTTYGIHAKKELDIQNRKHLLQDLSREHFLLFVFKGEEFFSSKAAQVAKHFEEANKWKVLALSLDGVSIDAFPSPLVDHGLSKQIQCDLSPSFYVVNPYSKRVIPVGAGLISVTQLEQNIELQFPNRGSDEP